MTDPKRCIEVVADPTGWHFYQCSRKRGYGKNGLFCKQHAKRHPAEALSVSKQKSEQEDP